MNSKENVCFQSLTLHGKTFEKKYITYNDIVNGGLLPFEIGDKPNNARGITNDSTPLSVSKNKKR